MRTDAREYLEVHGIGDVNHMATKLKNGLSFKQRFATAAACMFVAGLALASGASTVDNASSAQSLLKASALMQGGKYSEAIPLLDAACKANPHDVRACRILARAYLSSNQPDPAILTLKHVMEDLPETPQDFYGLGVAYALKHDLDPAFEWLGKAKQSHKLDMTTIESDKRFDLLRADPRYAHLLPKRQDFDNPFVDNVKIIREWDGEGSNDQFGWIARSVGDLDGDGVEDFVTSAPSKNIGGENAGKVYVYSTASGKLLWSAQGEPGDQLGSGLESAGDVDGDGFQDIVASAVGSDTAYVYSGRGGQKLLTVHGEAKGDQFGNHVSSVGDIDHDGHADFIVGAPGNNAAGKGAGRAYVYSGKDGHVLLTLTGQRAGDGFGSAVSGYSAGKNSFIVVGAPAAGQTKKGRVYVYDALSQKPKFTFDADASGSMLGYMFVSVLGDVDRDGVPDIYASDWSNSARGPSTGRIYVYSGRTGKRLYAKTGETVGEGFGTTQAVAGDVNHDGYADFVVGSWQYSEAAVSGGRAYLFSGKDGSLLKTYTSRIPGETFGFDAVGLGDVDGDGTMDLLITSGWSAVSGFHSGRVFVISSGIVADQAKATAPLRDASLKH